MVSRKDEMVYLIPNEQQASAVSTGLARELGSELRIRNRASKEHLCRCGEEVRSLQEEGTLFGKEQSETIVDVELLRIDAALMRLLDILLGLPSILLVVLLAVAADGIMERAGAAGTSGLRQAVNLVTLLVAIGGVSWLTLASKQDRLSERDIRDIRINPNGTAGWTILGVRASWTPNDIWTIDIGANNLLDHRYRVHGSGVDAPGRNVSVSIRSRW